jgi:hypothetical protein
LAFGTKVQAGDESFKAIETYAVGEQVLASGSSLAWQSAPVVFSSGTSVASQQENTVLVLYENNAIAVTSDHLFLVKDENDGMTLMRADRLTTEDNLVSPQGESVSIRSVHIGTYFAGFHNIVATSTDPPGEDLEGHLLNTQDIISGDYLLQLHARQDEAVPSFSPGNLERPPLGSPEYREEHGDRHMEAPDLPEGFERTIDIKVTPFNAPDVPPGAFVPAAALLVQVPPDAVS